MNDHSDSRLELPDELFTVRGRPVAYFATQWGGDLRVIERGYFPVSETGYRSLCRGPGTRRPTQAELDKLADNHEREILSLLRTCRKVLTTARGDALSRYLDVELSAGAATHRGFFAPDAIRIELWQHAYRLYSAIAECRRFQPAPVAPSHAWNAARCAEAIDAARAALPWLARLLAGDIALPPASYGRHCFAASAYVKLPPRQSPEPVGSILANPQAFAFADALDDAGPLADDRNDAGEDPDLETMPMPADDEDDSAPSPTPPAFAGSPEVEQLSLF